MEFGFKQKINCFEIHDNRKKLQTVRDEGITAKNGIQNRKSEETNYKSRKQYVR